MAGLATYRGKRRFGETPEPRGSKAKRRGNAFVIQKHDARRLHYDLRLELDGVMKSWAVTRGPSLMPGEKRLAVQVEDHPIEYNKFEGTIPKGEYGAGTVMIWDRGKWQPEADPHKGLRKGHLSFELDGEKLHGGWHLVRMNRKRGEKRDNWLLIKARDEAARTRREKDILTEEPRSATTGRTLEEIASGAKKGKARRAAHRKKRSRKSNGARETGARASKKKRGGDLGVRGALPGFVEPSLATLVDKAPDSDNWIHEIKFDGYRMQGRLDHGKSTLKTRRGLDWTSKFKPVADALKKLPAKRALLDGEIVSERENGISSFSQLQEDLKAKRGERLVYYVFDLLHLDGRDLRREPLEIRKDVLARLLARSKKSGPIRLSESIEERGSSVHRHACRMGLEGIVSKQRAARYRSGRGRDWTKTKCSDRQELVVAGFAPSTADSRAVGALVLGYYGNGKFHYAGRTGTGFTHEVARDLYRKLKKLERKQPPFGNLPKEERRARKAIWVDPKMVVEVDFHGWTHGERVRQASFQGVRDDKPAKQVKREIKSMSVAESRGVAPAKRGTAGKSATRKTTPKYGEVALTHPDRVYWEDPGISKRELVEFYIDIWDWMRPHILHRPISLLRCPEGIDGQCFFQKHAAAGIKTKFLHEVSEGGKKIISIDDRDGLIALVQSGVLEFHIRGTTINHLAEADRLVFDLDPGPGVKWKSLIDAAREVRERLNEWKLESFLKTSGGKGLHVVLPIKHTPWDDAKDFAGKVAKAMAADSPDRYIATATKSKRKGRIFIDYLRNSREATAIAPYSTRARPGAAVSVPIAWSDLGKSSGADQYTVKNLRDRLSRMRKDPWANIGRVKQPLPSKKAAGK